MRECPKFLRVLEGPPITLFRNTTWKCGRIQREVIYYLRRELKKGRIFIPINEIHRKYNFDVKEFIESLLRLEKRNIIRIGMSKNKS